MGPLGQNFIWSEVLCCPFCNQIFSNVRVPINLICGHTACLSCLHNKPKACPNDSVAIEENVLNYPINTAILTILNVPLDSFIDQSISKKCSKLPYNVVEIEKKLYSLASYLRVADSEKGGAVYSDLVSRTIQRKIISLLCSALIEQEGRIQAMKAIRSLSERIVTELICVVQNTLHLSTYLWSAVRARGCQFLGPAMQEDVLRLLLLTLASGELIARKNLVMYIVQTLTEDYPHVSKTCVGHVVQLLYRASCFNVIKRDGESSLMQLKEEFRNYESLRKEHDSQIVQIALEAGLRISPDQWSSLLYGDLHHRSYMQSIVDRLHSPQLLSNALKELRNSIEKSTDYSGLQKMLDNLTDIAEMDPEIDHNWELFGKALNLIDQIIFEYVSFNKKNHMNNNPDRYSKSKSNNGQRNQQSSTTTNFVRYKTRMCRDVLNGKNCVRKNSCSYAHQQQEFRQDDVEKNMYYQQNGETNNQQQQESGLNHFPSQINIPPPIEMVQIPIVPLQHYPEQMIGWLDNKLCVISKQFSADNGSVMIDNTSPQYISMMPMIVPPMAEIPPDQVYQKLPTAAPFFVMQHGEHNHPFLVQNTVQMMPGHPPPTVQPNGTYSFPMPTQMVYAPGAVWNQQINRPSFHQTDLIPAYPQQNQPIRPLIPPPVRQKSIRERKISEPILINSYSPEKIRSSLNDADESNLIARRNEVISRLRGMEITKDENTEEDSDGHVCFTVANSVLYDEVETYSNPLEFPPLPIQPLPQVPSTFSTTMTEVICNVANVPWAYSFPIESRKRFPYVRTVCPTTLLRIDSTKPATVQSDCSVMNIKDSIDQPLVTATIQKNNLSPQASYEMVDPFQLAERLPKVIQALALTPEDPQDFVSSSIDRIITVREQINDEIGATSSAVEKEQLKHELNIANSQLSVLDQQTKQTCLLKELKAIDEKIENLGITDS